MALNPDRRVRSEFAYHLRGVFDYFFQIIGFFKKNLLYIIEFLRAEFILYHKVAYVKFIRFRGRHSARRRVKLREITEFFKSGKFVSHRRRTYIFQMTFRKAFGRYRNGGFDIIVNHVLKYFFLPVRQFHFLGTPYV